MTRAGIYDAEKWYKIKDARLLAEFIALSSFGVTPTAFHRPVTFSVQVTAQTAISEVLRTMAAIKKAAKFPRHAKNAPGKKDGTRKALRRGSPHLSAPIFHGSHVQQVIPEIKNEFPLPTDEAIKIPFKINYLK